MLRKALEFFLIQTLVALVLINLHILLDGFLELTIAAAIMIAATAFTTVALTLGANELPDRTKRLLYQIRTSVIFAASFYLALFLIVLISLLLGP